MEFFKQVDLDWMGKAKYFFALSLTLLVVGGAYLNCAWRPLLWY